ncbi:L-serine dehydratase, iron-sulfur-dependent subunit beta [Bombiscardovia nodaiensis]|uniref:L-serine ammonia-lyase n=1 Tax=Bombiscardovia nodaiensis TaxID=2932181 RepID=A0ABM8B6M9_9BIFI|nr:L-serine dehydratase, iron-sulfur-dependent subunit beta [Bombiscardovia nodaiensis]
MAGEYRSVFDIIGPVMVGPSSSHTAGAVAIGRAARHLIGGLPDEAIIDYYESFAKTHKGHGTDYAIVSGLLGFAPDDGRVPNAVSIARDQGVHIEFRECPGPSPIDHPNTAVLNMRRGQRQMSIFGCSIGGGTVEIRRIQMNGYDLKPGGMLPLLLVEEPSGRPDSGQDDPVAQLAGAGDNLRRSSSYQSADGGSIMHVYDLDKPLSELVLQKIRRAAPQMIYIN